jgi:hypothetical protein
MHFHGGGYSDIKKQTKVGKNVLKILNKVSTGFVVMPRYPMVFIF